MAAAFHDGSFAASASGWFIKSEKRQNRGKGTLAEKQKIIIAIDGPAGSGKSSTAKKVAKVLHYIMLDSGAMYRAVTLLMLQQNQDPQDSVASAAAAKNATIKFDFTNGQRVFLNGSDVTDAIRTRDVTRNIAPVAANPHVREILVRKQRQLGENGGVVAEGRDIGTVVFPHAQLKVYMQASIEARAQRRLLQLQTTGANLDIEALKEEIRRRDESDMQRQYGALKIASDAVILDTSNLSFDEQVAIIVNEAKKRGA